MNKITPFFWFDTQAEEAARFYTSIFHNSKIVSTVPGPEGKVMVVSFELEGQPFTALNGGKPAGWNTEFSGATSFVIHCDTQEEVDYYWEKLGESGKTGDCGWINRDKFGLTWQVVPEALPRLLSDPDKAKAGRVMAAMMQMKKIDIAKLEEAASQG